MPVRRPFSLGAIFGGRSHAVDGGQGGDVENGEESGSGPGLGRGREKENPGGDNTHVLNEDDNKMDVEKVAAASGPSARTREAQCSTARPSNTRRPTGARKKTAPYSYPSHLPTSTLLASPMHSRAQSRDVDKDHLPLPVLSSSNNNSSHRPHKVKSSLKKRQEEQDIVLDLIHNMRAGTEAPVSAGRGRNRDRKTGSTSAAGTGRKSARIEGTGLRVRWARFKQRLGTGSALSESLLDGTGNGSTTDSSRFGGIGKNIQDPSEDVKDDDEFDEVVVDNALGGASTSHASDRNTHSASGVKDTSVPHPKSYTSNTESQSQRVHSFWDSIPVVSFVRWRVYPLLDYFFAMRFYDGTEMEFAREAWWTSKTLGLYSSLFFIINWGLIIGLGVRPFSLSDRIFYYGILTPLVFPLPFVVIYDIPRYRPILYQTFIATMAWSLAIYNTVYMYACDFFGTRTGVDHCGSRDFITFFFYAIGCPTIAMFGLRMSRLANVAFLVPYFIINAVLILPEHPAFTRNVVDMLLFHFFLLYIHYRREATERRNYALRAQLKIQFRATQKAQVNERRAADSKKRLTSYVFHEVRVPLNTAMLALQNMEATGQVATAHHIEWTALSGSLSMMSKVLNDVLDFDRLDSGRFATVDMPYNLHQTIKSILVPLRLATEARGLQLTVELDDRIDQVALRAARAALDLSGATSGDQENAADVVEGLVRGDEMRLRQIVNNLASNACKFTQTGGEIKIVTRLVYPILPDSSGVIPSEGIDTGSGSRERWARKMEEKMDSKEKAAGGGRDQSTDGRSGSGASGTGKGGGKTPVSPSSTRMTGLLPLLWRRTSNRVQDAASGVPIGSRTTTISENDAGGGRRNVNEDVSLDTAEKGLGRRGTLNHGKKPAPELEQGENKGQPLSMAHLVRHNSYDAHTLNRIVVRVEVHDTGVGIRAKDLVDHKLFSPYVQTEIGKYQGGKGTGLGLALVRRIVKLSGGRLGVKSKLGQGSTFWVELPLGIGERAVSERSRPGMPHESSDGYSDGQRQMALGLEDLKFARAIGEGETPSTLIETEKMAVDAALPAPSEENAAEVNAHATEGSTSSHATQALDSVSVPITTHVPNTIGVSSASLPTTVSERAAKNIMDQSGGFDIVTPPISAISALRVPQRAGIPTMTPPLSLIPPTPPQASEVHVGTSTIGASIDNTLRPPQTVNRAPHSAPPAPEADTSTPTEVVEASLKPSGSTPSSTSINTNSEKPFANVRVLVVDDDALTRMLMTRMLQRLGCSVTLAENGRIALEKILGGALPSRLAASVPNLQNLDTTSFMPHREQVTREGNDGSGEKEAHVYLFDVVFLDNQMPVMSGLDTVAALRTLGREDLVVGVTGNALASDQQEYLDKGVDSVLTKPVREGSLRSMLQVAMKKRQDRTKMNLNSPL